jgi:chorismate mutase
MTHRLTLLAERAALLEEIAGLKALARSGAAG